MRGKNIIPIFLMSLSLITSCNLLNPTYRHASKSEQKKLTPLSLNSTLLQDCNFLSKKDTVVNIYKIDVSNLRELVKNTNKDYVLCVSIYLYCSGARQSFDSVLQINPDSPVELVVLNTIDWYYANKAREFFKRKHYYKPLFIVDVTKYGYAFDSRTRWFNFVKEINPQVKKINVGVLDAMLFDKKFNLIYSGSFHDCRKVINQLIHYNVYPSSYQF